MRVRIEPKSSAEIRLPDGIALAELSPNGYDEFGVAVGSPREDRISKAKRTHEARKRFGLRAELRYRRQMDGRHPARPDPGGPGPAHRTHRGSFRLRALGDQGHLRPGGRHGPGRNRGDVPHRGAAASRKIGLLPFRGLPFHGRRAMGPRHHGRDSGLRERVRREEGNRNAERHLPARRGRFRAEGRSEATGGNPPGRREGRGDRLDGTRLPAALRPGGRRLGRTGAAFRNRTVPRPQDPREASGGHLGHVESAHRPGSPGSAVGGGEDARHPRNRKGKGNPGRQIHRNPGRQIHRNPGRQIHRNPGRQIHRNPGRQIHLSKIPGRWWRMP
jgi:hypothetical protein